MVDLDPEQVASLTRLIGARNRQHDEIHVLHEQGRVLRVIRTSTPGSGALEVGVADLGRDLDAAARTLRRTHEAERVVLVDRHGLVALGPALAACGPGDVDQPTMLRRSSAIFWSSPAVVTDPAAPLDPWPPVDAWLQALPSSASVFVGAFDADGIRLAFDLRFEQGRLTRVSSGEVTDRDGALDHLAQADAGAVVTWDQVVEASDARDPWAVILGWADDARTVGWRGTGGS
jgi:hypothetical protein